MFNTILIANRGEIACRIARTCQNLGIQTVAVYSDADAHAAHVLACDQAVHLGGNAAQDSYLRADKIIQAARQTGAQAIHPGYGFLSENADFAQACVEAGLVFIGAPAASIRAMGSKSAAKQLMETAQVPLVPGYHGENQDPLFLLEQADRIGYPVLLKASAGGGGKGMRIVTQREDFVAALASCKREAINSFGDDKVLVERYVSRPRHIEVQVFADQFDHCIYLFDRDCSVQRRHQKVIEEAPAPLVSDTLRHAMGQAAVNAARAVNYQGAGTIEFIVEADEHGHAKHFFFMEMNTRLQVEHPVTEMITGQDLVAWQIRVAAGQPLPLKQSDLTINGHAIEVRIYAENPDNQFLPSTGTLSTLIMPPSSDASLRIDTGVRQGDVISPFYDPMIAKMIAWGANREQARLRMARALAQTFTVGVTTNVTFLQRLMQCQAFKTPLLSTALIEHHHAELLPPDEPLSVVAQAALVCDQLIRESVRATHQVREINNPWQRLDGWLVSGGQTRVMQFEQNDDLTYAIRLRYADHQTDHPVHQPQVLHMTFSETTHRVSYEVDHNPNHPSIRVTMNGQQHVCTVLSDPLQPRLRYVWIDGRLQKCRYVDPLDVQIGTHHSTGKLSAPMPGKVVTVSVELGQKVRQHAPLLVIEAMKMEHTITAPFDGIVQAIHYEPGEQVAEGIELLTFVALTDVNPDQTPPK